MPSLDDRLATRGRARQREVSRRADACAAAADRAAGRVWRRLLAVLRASSHWGDVQVLAARVLAGLSLELQRQLAAELARATRWGWRSAVYNVRQTVPQRLLVKAATRKGGVTHGGSFVDSRRRAAAESHLRPDDPGPLLVPVAEDDGAASFSFIDLLRSLLPAGDADHDNQHAPADFLAVLFPAPTPQFVASVVYDSDWQQRLAASTRLAAPERLASVVAASVARGESHRDIMRQILPIVDGVRSTARRIARTEALRVAGATQMACHKQLGDLVVGYTVHSAHVPDSRPWHVARSGTTYYADPGLGQKGYPQMPHPPDEPADPAERPAGTPATAWNCLCHLTPVLRD